MSADGVTYSMLKAVNAPPCVYIYIYTYFAYGLHQPKYTELILAVHLNNASGASSDPEHETTSFDLLKSHRTRSELVLDRSKQIHG